jgi:hypothetical protein
MCQVTAICELCSFARFLFGLRAVSVFRFFGVSSLISELSDSARCCVSVFCKHLVVQDVECMGFETFPCLALRVCSR